MARPISYDNVGFFSFAIALLSLVLVPFTLVKVRNLLRSCCGGATKRKKKSKGPTWLPVLGSALGWCFVVVGWFILIQMTRQVVGTSTEVFDPHEILGVSTSARGGAPRALCAACWHIAAFAPPPQASARNIKKAYRKLSLTAHPDKGGDPVLFTQARPPGLPSAHLSSSSRCLSARTEVCAPKDWFARLVPLGPQVVKAYETLTDEKSMDNWRKYGHPDGQERASVPACQRLAVRGLSMQGPATLTRAHIANLLVAAAHRDRTVPWRQAPARSRWALPCRPSCKTRAMKRPAAAAGSG